MTSVLLLEDDPTLSLLYRRMFERYFDCTVTDAADGLEGLRKVVDERPDLVVLDVHLPFLSGVDVLQAIRGNPDIADTPCIAITSENSRAIIERLVACRVLDIMLKPVDLTRDVPRLRKILAKLPEARSQQRTAQQLGARLLLVSSDATFRDFASQILNGRYTIETAATGLVGVEALMASPPSIVLVSEQLRLLPEWLFMKAVRGRGHNLEHTQFVLVADSAESVQKATERMGFDTAFVKSFVPDQFLREFARVVEQGTSGPVAQIRHLRRHLHHELMSAAQQALGVMVNEEVVIEDRDVEVERAVVVRMPAADGQLTVSVGLEIPGEMTAKLGNLLLGLNHTEADVTDMLGELAQTISGRIRSLANEHGVKLDSGDVSSTVPSDSPLIRQSLSTALGAFSVSLAVA